MATSRQINEVLDDLEMLVGMVAKGAALEQIATTLGWQPKDLRRAARWESLDLSPMAAKVKVCSGCGRHASELDKTGFCRRCQLRTRIERLSAVYAAEERREVARLSDEMDVVKQAGKRMREEYGINPRKGARD